MIQLYTAGIGCISPSSLLSRSSSSGSGGSYLSLYSTTRYVRAGGTINGRVTVAACELAGLLICLHKVFVPFEPYTILSLIHI